MGPGNGQTLVDPWSEAVTSRNAVTLAGRVSNYVPIGPAGHAVRAGGRSSVGGARTAGASGATRAGAGQFGVGVVGQAQRVGVDLGSYMVDAAVRGEIALVHDGLLAVWGTSWERPSDRLTNEQVVHQ